MINDIVLNSGSGNALAFLITMAKSPMIFMAGAMIAGWIGTMLVMAIVRHTVIKEDAALGMILSVFLGFGLVLLTLIQRLPTALGFPVKRIELILTLLTVTAIVMGLQTVGVILMSAMIIAPAAAARQWTDRLWLMVVLSAIFGAVSGLSGWLCCAASHRTCNGFNYECDRINFTFVCPQPRLDLGMGLT